MQRNSAPCSRRPPSHHHLHPYLHLDTDFTTPDASRRASQVCEEGAGKGRGWADASQMTLRYAELRPRYRFAEWQRRYIKYASDLLFASPIPIDIASNSQCARDALPSHTTRGRPLHRLHHNHVRTRARATTAHILAQEPSRRARCAPRPLVRPRSRPPTLSERLAAQIHGTIGPAPPHRCAHPRTRPPTATSLPEGTGAPPPHAPSAAPISQGPGRDRVRRSGRHGI